MTQLVQGKMNIMNFFRYIIVGGFGAVVHVGIIFLLVEFIKLSPLVSSVIGFVFVLIISFLLNKHWTFQIKVNQKFQFTKYLIVSLIGLLLNTLIIFITVNVLNWSYEYGVIIMVIVVALNNFILNQFWTFKK